MENNENNIIYIMDLKVDRGFLIFNVSLQRDFMFKNMWINLKRKQLRWNASEYDISEQFALLIRDKALSVYKQQKGKD